MSDVEATEHTTYVRRVADRLNRSQASTILNLDATFAVLGCSEPNAARLAVANSRRPSLTKKRKGELFNEYALTEIGLAVQADLKQRRATA